MIPIAPNLPAAAERAIYCTCNTDREAADSARQRSLVCSLGDEMNVVLLNAELDDAKPGVR